MQDQPGDGPAGEEWVRGPQQGQEEQADSATLSLVESFSSWEVYLFGERELVQMLIFNFLKIEL